MPATKTSHPIGIKIYDINRQLLEGASVSLTLRSLSPLSETSNSKGEVVFNVANAGSWSVGEEVSLTASKTGSGTKTSTLVLTSSPQQTSMTLEETSDLIYYEQSETDTYVLNFALITTYDGEKVTNSNPLPVTHGEIDLFNNPSTTWSITRDDLQPNYEEVTIRGDTYRRTFTYNSNGAMTARSAWVKR